MIWNWLDIKPWLCGEIQNGGGGAIKDEETLVGQRTIPCSTTWSEVGRRYNHEFLANLKRRRRSNRGWENFSWLETRLQRMATNNRVRDLRDEIYTRGIWALETNRGLGLSFGLTRTGLNRRPKSTDSSDHGPDRTWPVGSDFSFRPEFCPFFLKFGPDWNPKYGFYSDRRPDQTN